VKVKKYADVFRHLTMVTQFGISLLTPTVFCLLICWWIISKTGVGEWIYIIGFIFGLGSSFMVAYKLYLSVMSKEEKQKEKRKTVSFNKHM
jgi:preprotein translocase subunit SecF